MQLPSKTWSLEIKLPSKSSISLQKKTNLIKTVTICLVSRRLQQNTLLLHCITLYLKETITQYKGKCIDTANNNICLHILVLILGLLVFIPFLLYDEQNGARFCKSNGNNNEIECNLVIISKYLNLVKNQRIISLKIYVFNYNK